MTKYYPIHDDDAPDVRGEAHTIPDEPQTLYCDDCTDKGHCPEYIPGAPCVNERR